MAASRSIVLNGDLGSGKSTVSRLLAERLGIRRISVGDLYREMARQRGLTALQLNRHAELDDKIDFYVDQLQKDIAASGEQLIVDSRLAWFFFTDALKVHIIADPQVAALRALSRPGDTVESYATVAEAIARMAQRSESERSRFLTRYGADKTRWSNYDLVLDATTATPAEIADRIEDAYFHPRHGTTIYLDPRRLTTQNATRPTAAGPRVAAAAVPAAAGGPLTLAAAGVPAVSAAAASAVAARLPVVSAVTAAPGPAAAGVPVILTPGPPPGAPAEQFADAPSGLLADAPAGPPPVSGERELPAISDGVDLSPSLPDELVVVGGQRRLDDAIRAGEALVEVRLAPNAC